MPSKEHEDIMLERAEMIQTKIESILPAVQRCIDGSTNLCQENVFKQVYFILTGAHSLTQVASGLSEEESDIDSDEDEEDLL